MFSLYHYKSFSSLVILVKADKVTCCKICQDVLIVLINVSSVENVAAIHNPMLCATISCSARPQTSWNNLKVSENIEIIKQNDYNERVNNNNLLITNNFVHQYSSAVQETFKRATSFHAVHVRGASSAKGISQLCERPGGRLRRKHLPW